MPPQLDWIATRPSKAHYSPSPSAHPVPVFAWRSFHEGPSRSQVPHLPPVVERLESRTLPGDALGALLASLLGGVFDSDPLAPEPDPFRPPNDRTARTLRRAEARLFASEPPPAETNAVSPPAGRHGKPTLSAAASFAARTGPRDVDRWLAALPALLSRIAARFGGERNPVPGVGGGFGAGRPDVPGPTPRRPPAARPNRRSSPRRRWPRSRLHRRVRQVRGGATRTATRAATTEATHPGTITRSRPAGPVAPAGEVGVLSATVGQWGPVLNWPLVTVHSHMLPTGKVLLWAYGQDPRRIWDPATGQIETAIPAAPGYNIFCVGHSFLADGRLFVAGGHVQNGWGLPNASIYDPVANTWTRVPDMNAGRWYPTSTTLPNGDVLVTSGSMDINYTNNTLPQVYQVASNTWRNLTDRAAQPAAVPVHVRGPQRQGLQRRAASRCRATWTPPAPGRGPTWPTTPSATATTARR